MRTTHGDFVNCPEAHRSAHLGPASAGSLAIQTNELSKRFKGSWHPWRRAADISVLENVDINVAYGQILGLTGPNGAGKTTLVRILAGMLLPTTGAATVAGRTSANPPGIRAVVGLASGDDRGFYGRLSGRQNLAFFGALRGLSAASLAARLNSAITLFELQDVADRAVQKYSSGQRQRLSLARATLHEPQVLLLDEPTRGLDPVMTERVEHWLSEWVHASSDRGVLLVSHDLEQIERISHRVGILLDGQLVLTASVDELHNSRHGRPGTTLRQVVRGLMGEARG